ncbi:hypothetical protein BZA70DRAFT_202741 [Myxozyma melibiosi]|uniref:Zn(2)-C6 fungal-type domain-containing protein n=1 Tax=Myxozyma melibiosi TaxID=54550 RepID=A0ABR1F2T0_9ASCO
MEVPAPVSTACLACRSRHLKCDAGVPVCQRCKSAQRECVYVKSRRGWKSSPSSSSSSTASSSLSSSTVSSVDGVGLPKRRLVDVDISAADLTAGASTGLRPIDSAAVSAPPSLIDLYFYYFHNAHPVVVPRSFYSTLISGVFDSDTNAIVSDLLAPVVHFTGSFYSENADSKLYQNAIDRLVFGDISPSTDHTQTYSFILTPSPFAVQALLIYMIVLHSSNEQTKSLAVRNYVVDMALYLGMQNVSFIDSFIASSCRSQDPIFRSVLRESLVRTFWMLYVMDAWLTSIHCEREFKLATIPRKDYPLPCEQDEYDNGLIPPSPTRQDFVNRIFAEDTRDFSSFAYLIDAVHTSGVCIFQAYRTRSDERAVQMVDTSISTWLLHLPESKKKMLLVRPTAAAHFFDPSGRGGREVDELMLMASTIIHNMLILMHKRLSHFALVPNAYEEIDNTCFTPRSLLISFRARALSYRHSEGYKSRTPSTVEELNYLVGSFGGNADSSATDAHTAKCLASADALANLISYAADSITRRSPFFTCGILLSAIVHLSACVWDLFPKYGDARAEEQDRELAKERVKLAVGSLRALSGVWDTASVNLGQIKEAARIVFQQREAAATYLSQLKNADSVMSFQQQQPQQQRDQLYQQQLLQQQQNVPAPTIDASLMPSTNNNNNNNYIWSETESTASSVMDSYSTGGSIGGFSPYDPLSTSTLNFVSPTAVSPSDSRVPARISNPMPSYPPSTTPPQVQQTPSQPQPQQQQQQQQQQSTQQLPVNHQQLPYLTAEDKIALAEIKELPVSYVDETEFYQLFDDETLVYQFMTGQSSAYF